MYVHICIYVYVAMVHRQHLEVVLTQGSTEKATVHSRLGGMPIMSMFLVTFSDVRGHEIGLLTHQIGCLVRSGQIGRLVVECV